MLSAKQKKANEETEVLGQLMKCLKKDHSMIEVLKKVVVIKDQITENDTMEIVRLRNKAKDLKVDHLNSKSTHSKDIEDLPTDVKRDAVIGLFQTRIKMALEVTAKGFDASIWEVQSCKEKLVELKGEDLDSEQGHGEEANKDVMEVKEGGDVLMGDDG